MQEKQTQLEKMRKSKTTTVAIVGDKAYWVHENIFYESGVINGHVDKDNAKPVDAHKLSTKQFEKLLSILDNIS